MVGEFHYPSPTMKTNVEMSSLSVKTTYGMIYVHMLQNVDLKTVLAEQQKFFEKKSLGVERDQLTKISKLVKAPFAVVITGLRRCGKSTLLAQIENKYHKGRGFFVNFEDERLTGFESEDFNNLHSDLAELFGEKKVFFLDEIQNVSGWERWVRRMIDDGYKIYITGSNASLLSQELGSRLTGRHVTVEIFPFSFKEYLMMIKRKYKIGKQATTLITARHRSWLKLFLLSGGIPDAVSQPSIQWLKILYDDVMYRDIAARYKIESLSSLKALGYYLMSNIAELTSYNKLKQLLFVSSQNTVKDYVTYMNNAYLIFPLSVFSYSVKRQLIAPKKIYAVDTGLARSVSQSTLENTGKLLENAVFLELKRRYGNNVYYYKSEANLEVDFYIPSAKLLIQVCEKLDSPDTIGREVKGLNSAIAETPRGTRGIILSSSFVASNMSEYPTFQVADWLYDSKNMA